MNIILNKNILLRLKTCVNNLFTMNRFSTQRKEKKIRKKIKKRKSNEISKIKILKIE